MDTSGYQVSDPDDFDFFWENDQLDLGAVFRRWIETPSHPAVLDDLETGGLAENPKLLDKEED